MKFITPMTRLMRHSMMGKACGHTTTQDTPKTQLLEVKTSLSYSAFLNTIRCQLQDRIKEYIKQTLDAAGTSTFTASYIKVFNHESYYRSLRDYVARQTNDLNRKFCAGHWLMDKTTFQVATTTDWDYKDTNQSLKIQNSDCFIRHKF